MSLVHSHNTRNCDQLRINQCHFCTTIINSKYELGLRLYNMLPQSFKRFNKPVFKK